eukprot:2627150-Karenia_brevis.AAC.1
MGKMYSEGPRKRIGIPLGDVLGWTHKINSDGPRKCIVMTSNMYSDDDDDDDGDDDDDDDMMMMM